MSASGLICRWSCLTARHFLLSAWKDLSPASGSLFCGSSVAWRDRADSGQDTQALGAGEVTGRQAAAGTVAIAPEALIPICTAVVTAHLSLSLVRTYVVRNRKLEIQETD